MALQSLILTGTVVDTKDPDGLGRIQVELRGFGAALTTPWIRVVQPTASEGFGHLFLPEKGDEVLVLRGMGDCVQGLLVLGSLYNNRRKPAFQDDDGKNDRKEIRTRSGSALTFDDKKGEESVCLSADDGKLRVRIDVKNGIVEIAGDKEIVLVADKKVTVRADEVVVKGGKRVTIDGGPNVEIKGSSAVKIEGGKIEVSGQSISLG